MTGKGNGKKMGENKVKFRKLNDNGGCKGIEVSARKRRRKMDEKVPGNRRVNQCTRWITNHFFRF